MVAIILFTDGLTIISLSLIVLISFVCGVLFNYSVFPMNKHKIYFIFQLRSILTS